MSNFDNISARPADLKILKNIQPTVGGIVGASYVTSPEIASVYGMPASDGAGVKIGILSFFGGFDQSDLELAFTDLRNSGLIPSGTVAPTINKVLLDGKTGLRADDPFNGSANIENILDIILIATMVPAADITLYIGAGWNSIISRAAADGCHFLNASWISSEAPGMDSWYAPMFANADSKKMTILAASGDYGSSVQSNQPTGAGWPASSPNVISVGGTYLEFNHTTKTRILENYDNRYTSGGGGISSLYDLPEWQAGLYYTPISASNVIGTPTPLTKRGIPDISAPFINYGIYDGGTLFSVGGTSAATPVILGILARIQSLTGTIRTATEYNQLFYSHKSAFLDTSSGQNNFTAGGYIGTSGWDPLTGLGPPLDSTFYNILGGSTPPGPTIVDPTNLTPPQIAIAYNIPAGNGAGVKIGIICCGGNFLQSDLELSFADLRTAGLIGAGVATPQINRVLVDGGFGNFGDYPSLDTEVTLDIYCVATMVPAANITVYISNGSYSSPISRAIADGCDILTCSWAQSEDGAVAAGALTEIEPILALANTNKITYMMASGDFGSATHAPAPGVVLDIIYPASSPNAISVGGTNLTLNSDNTRSAESDYIAGGGFAGGGGISKQFSAPSWQAGLYYTPIVNGVTGTPETLTMRGVPDIAGPFNSYGFYLNGQIVNAGGTSASCPFLAGVLARMQQLTGKKRSSAEYNRLFYSNPNAFYDILVGSNNSSIADGYAGTVAWDPVTGLGPPIGDKLYKVLKRATTRPNSGFVFPNPNCDNRPRSGQAWPRRKMR